MPSLLFEKGLEQTISPHAKALAEGSDTPFADARLAELHGDGDGDDDDHQITDILTAFAHELTDDALSESSEHDLEAVLDVWCGHYSIDETAIHVMKGVLVETAKEAYGIGTDDEIRKVLKVLRTTPSKG
jgi:hypothetical protein